MANSDFKLTRVLAVCQTLSGSAGGPTGGGRSALFTLQKSQNSFVRDLTGPPHSLAEHQCIPRTTALDRLKEAIKAERDDAISHLRSHEIEEILACDADYRSIFVSARGAEQQLAHERLLDQKLKL